MRNVLFVLALSLPALAFGNPPNNLTSAEQYTRAAMCTWGHSVAVSGTADTVRTSTGTSGSPFDRGMLFPFGSMVSIECDNPATFCWVQEDAATITATGYISDASSQGAATVGNRGCFRVGGNSYRDQVVIKGNFTRNGSSQEAVSLRTGSCRHTGSPTIDRLINGYPCDANNDCFYSGATCAAATTPKGVFLRHIAGTGTPSCYVCLEQ